MKSNQVKQSNHNLNKLNRSLRSGYSYRNMYSCYNMGADVYYRTAGIKAKQEFYVPHIEIHRWQTISGNKGSDNTIKTPPAVERFPDNSKRTPLVCVLFCFNKEALSVFPF